MASRQRISLTLLSSQDFFDAEAKLQSRSTSILRSLFSIMCRDAVYNKTIFCPRKVFAYTFSWIEYSVLRNQNIGLFCKLIDPRQSTFKQKLSPRQAVSFFFVCLLNEKF